MCMLCIYHVIPGCATQLDVGNSGELQYMLEYMYVAIYFCQELMNSL